MAEIKTIKGSNIPVATTTVGFEAFGIRVNPDSTVDNVRVPYALLIGSTPIISAEIDTNGDLIMTIDYQRIQE
jgi:hypothetical protein